jgi:hypothetical protein
MSVCGKNKERNVVLIHPIVTVESWRTLRKKDSVYLSHTSEWRLGECLSVKQFLYIDADCRACEIIPSDINIVDSLINFHSCRR